MARLSLGLVGPRAPVVEEAGFPGFTSTVIGVCGFKGVRLAWVWGLGFRVKFFLWWLLRESGFRCDLRMA